MNNAQLDALKSDLSVISQELENLQRQEQTATSKTSHILTPQQVSAARILFAIK